MAGAFNFRYAGELGRGGEVASVLNVRAGYEPQPMFDRRAFPIYAIITAELALSVILFTVLGLRFADFSLAMPSVSVLIVLASAWAARRGGFPRLATWLEATALAYLSGLAGWALLFPATALSLPFADPWLSAIDNLLGFDFAVLDAAVGGWSLHWIYHSFDWQTALIIPALVIARRDPWPFVYALTFAMVLTFLVYPLAPAMGPRVYYGMIAPDRQTFMIEALRDRHAQAITAQMMVGMVSFPSFHAATAAIFAWAMWPVKLLRWPFAVLNVAVILTTMTEGDHYLIDVIAGLAVGAVALWVATKLLPRSTSEAQLSKRGC